MKIKVLIVEDEVLVAEDLADFLQENGFHICGIAISAEECFRAIKRERPDILLIDIYLKGEKKGTEIASLLNENEGIPFIFLTANTDQTTIQNALAQRPGAYISKPFSKEDVKIAIELVCQKYNTQVIKGGIQTNNYSNYIFIKEGALYKRIDINTILYIEAKGSYSTIVTPVKSYTLSYNLNHFSSQVQGHSFKKVHRSFIVNIKNVEAFDNNSLIIGERTIPVSKQHQREIMKLFFKL